MRDLFVRLLLTGILPVGLFCSTGNLRAQNTAAAKSAAKSAAKIHAGEQTFTQNCHQCHAVFAGQTSFGPNLAGEMKKSHPKKSSAEVRAIILNGKAKMPAFKEKLTQQESDDLLAYIRTL